MVKKYLNKKGVSLIVFVFGIMGILAFASFVIDTGMVLNAQNELQKAVQTTALVGAASLEPKVDASGNITVDTTGVATIMDTAFNKIKASNSVITNAKMTKATDIQVKGESKAVRINATLGVDTYFIKFVGIYKITVQAQAAAMSSPFYLSTKFPTGLNPGSLIDYTSGDTNLRNPIGDNNNENDTLTNIIGYPDNKGVSFGPGGYVTVKLPVPLVDATGFDLYIRTLGNKKGYFVFAGTDKDPNNPYVDEMSPGGGISWMNISCTGTPTGTNTTGKVGAYKANISYLGGTSSETKFYGSGYFDIGAKCSGDPHSYNANVKTAKYLKIIDDNVEDGFMAQDSSVPFLLIGDHNSVTPGLTIDAIAVLHHTRLISISDYSTDSDGDGVINLLEDIIGTDSSVADTDGDGISDALEYIGWYDNSGTPTSIINHTSKTVYVSNPIESNAESGTIDYNASEILHISY